MSRKKQKKEKNTKKKNLNLIKQSNPIKKQSNPIKKQPNIIKKQSNPVKQSNFVKQSNPTLKQIPLKQLNSLKEFNLLKQFNPFFAKLNTLNYGKVLSIKDGVVTGSGLETVCFGELVCFNNNKDIVGIVLTLRKKKVEIVMLQNEKSLQIGHSICRLTDSLGRKGKFPSVTVGYELLGKHIDSLGNLLNKEDLSKQEIIKYLNLTKEARNIFKKAPGIIKREPVTFPFYTGIQVIDAFFPIGCGQRELLIGDKFTGKTTIAVTAILNQKETNMELIKDIKKKGLNKIKLINHIKKEHVFCIYSGIGQRRSSILRIYNLLKKEQAMLYTCIVSSTSSCKAALQYLTPYVATTIGEYFMEKGHNSFVVYDDLSNHAVAYRQMALLLRRPPGREAFPGDIFYIHSSLLERSAQMSKHSSGGSLTSFPVIETQCGDVSSYIPTNVISITDGQIYLDTNLFNKGIRPAVHIGLSVSRVGSAAQNITIKIISRKLKVQMSEYNRLVGSTSMSTDIDPSLANIIATGLRLTEVFKQRNPRPYFQQILIGYSSATGFTNEINPNFIMLYYKLLFNLDFMRQLVNRMQIADVDKTLWYAADYFSYNHPFNNLFNFFLKVYSIEKIKRIVDIDAIFTKYTKIFIMQFQPRLEKILKKKKVTFI